MVKLNISDLFDEIEEEIDRLVQKIDKPKNIPLDVTCEIFSYLGSQIAGYVISEDNLVDKRYYHLHLSFEFDQSKIIDSPEFPISFLKFLIEK